MDVLLRSAGSQIGSKALVDTGAPVCVFPRGVGDLLGLDFPEYPSDASDKVQLMGRVWPAVSANVELMLKPFVDDAWSADVLFVLDDGLPFGLLGYAGFLNRWAVGVNGYLGYFIVESVDDFDARQPAGVLDKLRRDHPS